MLRSSQKLEGIRILAANQEVGTVEEAYFDDEQWVVRYLVVDTGGWLGGRRVLISPYAVQSIDWQHRSIFVNLTRSQVEGSPRIDTDKPVSRQQEAEYHRYFGYPQYWQSPTFWPWGAMPVITAPDPQIQEEEEARRRADAVPSRSAAPGARFWTKTSARAISRSSTSRPSGRFTSSVSDCFDRFSQTK